MDQPWGNEPLSHEAFEVAAPRESGRVASLRDLVAELLQPTRA